MKSNTRRGRLASLTALFGAFALMLSACSGGNDTPAPGGESGNTAGAAGALESGNADYDAIVNDGPVADEATIASSEWATKVKEAGVLRVGGSETSELFSKLDPTTGVVTGFDAGLFQLLAHYILGDASAYDLTQVSVDTREELLVNGQVDTVFATYSITDERLKRIDFAGPYYSSASAILVKKDNSDINGIDDLAGKTVATQAASTGVTTLEEFAPEAEILALPDHAQAVQALQQGRADAYVIDQTLLLNAVVQNDDLKVVGEPFGAEDLYGIGLPKDSDAVDFVNTFLKEVEDDGSWLKLWQLTIGDRTGVLSQPTPPAITTGSDASK
ncbi:MAG: glutamate ABC transporter substrate-binding protein [Ancrocorticia sp.]